MGRENIELSKFAPLALATAMWLFVCASGLWAQQLRVASYNMERLGENRKDYSTLARVVSSFDLVAAEEVMNPRGMSDVLSQLGVGWSDTMSEVGEGSRRYKEYFGFFFDQKVELVRALGIYPTAHEFFRPPYGAQFRCKGSDLTFNLVACHIVYGKSERERLAEIRHLSEVYSYFEGVTGNQGITMIVGDFNEDKSQAFQSLYDLNDQEVIPAEGTTIGSRGPDHAYDHIFLPRLLRDLEIDAGVDYWTTAYASTRTTVSDHFPVYVVLKTVK
jgi:deoxyribonuclease-1-like protein